MEKNLETKVEQIQIQNPESDVEIWAMDELPLEDSLPLRYRVGLKHDAALLENWFINGRGNPPVVAPSRLWNRLNLLKVFW
ncbi:MAG TPA: hypothetical protein V6C95_21575 [Coleofasciculaceae cyanobacterium]